jgi:glycosyltransferase involved in cell wall biosynthesis
MRVLILADDFFAAREQALLSRIEVGLADEGVRVVHAIPQSAAAYAPGEVISKVMVYPDHVWSPALGATARKLSRELERISQGDEPGRIDVVHVFGGSCWNLGAQLAREFAAGMVVEVWRAGLVEQARQLVSQVTDEAASPLRTDVKSFSAVSDRISGLMFLAPDQTIEERLRASVRGTVRCVPWGVHVVDSSRRLLDSRRSPTAMMVGTGRDAKAFAAALEGLAIACRSNPDLLIFCDAQAARRADLHRLARRLNILDRLSLIDELEGRRDLVIEGDLLIQPDASGEQRSVTLDAMAHGMVVIAAADPLVSILIDGRTARLVQNQSSDSWATTIREVLSDSAGADRLAGSAAAYVRENRRASTQVRGILDAYDAVGSGRVIAFKAR